MTRETDKLLSAALTRFVMLGRKIGRVRGSVSRNEEELDAIEREFGDLLDNFRRLVRHLIGTRVDPTGALKRVGVTLRPHWYSRDSSREVGSVVLVARPDGSAVAQIDGVGIPLPPNVAALLSILKADGGVYPDHLVGWKSVGALQAGLKERSNQNHSKAAVKELIYRLRRLLEQHGGMPSLVQNHPRFGYRFALRRGVSNKTEMDNP